jgi:predicted alpha/beta-fold hydrolase
MNQLPLFSSTPGVTPFQAPRWLCHPHAQTLYGALYAPTGTPRWQRASWDTPDDDFIHVDSLPGVPGAPLLVIFHGLEGGTDSRYVRALSLAAQARGWSVCAPNFRSCSGVINRAPRLYHAGDSTEIDWILKRAAEPNSRPVMAVGVSLGGNMLLKWLGEQGARVKQILHAAAAVAAPLDLAAVGDNLSLGFNRIYTHHFLSTLKQKARAKYAQYPYLFDLQRTLSARTMRDFDDHFMGPVHGFRNAEDYWARSSSTQYLPLIELPTLLLNAQDDPFMPAAVLPDAHQCAATVTRDFPEQGGHVGFVSGRFPGHLNWMPQRVLNFLAATLNPIR